MSDPAKSRTRFLERQTYRRARLEDAARLLPILGSFLVLGPVAIQSTGVERGDTDGWLVYFLAVWLGLIVLAGCLARALSGPRARRGTPPPTDTPPR